MKKITGIMLAAMMFVGGFGSGNIYRSVCQAEVSDRMGAVGDAEADVEAFEDTVLSESEVILEQETEQKTEKQSETAAVGLESSLLTENTATSRKGTQLTEFEIIEQYPELPTGCEITAMTMVLNYYGYDVDKVTMALDYMPKVPAEFYRGTDGRLMGPDLENYFVGDPTQDSGYICGTGAIVTAANTYLTDVGSDLTAVALKNAQPEELYALIDQGIPVVIWCTINMEDRAETDGWYREDGTFMEWSTNDHGAVLIGYDEDTVTVADPIYNRITVSREQFEKILAERGGQCVILKDDGGKSLSF